MTNGIRAVNFEALIRAAVLIGQAQIMEHRACIKQFGIESESATLACQGAPVVDAARNGERAAAVRCPAPAPLLSPAE
jgi:hypothetical protein